MKLSSQKGIAQIAIVYGIIGMMGLVLTVFVATREVRIPDRTTELPLPTSDGTMCTADAKLCPDGSYVSRSGPDCEFAPCPVKVGTSGWETHRNDEYGFEFILPPGSFLLSSYPSQKRYQNVKDIEKRFLDKDEYFMEIYALDDASEKSCQDFFADDFPANFEQINLNGLLLYLSIKSATVISEGPGYGKPLYALCVPTYRGRAFMVSIRVDSQDGEDMARNILLSFNFYDNPSVSGTFCGGIAGIPCPAGQTCKLDGAYPDAGGKCIKDKLKPVGGTVGFGLNKYGFKMTLPGDWTGMEIIENNREIIEVETGKIIDYAPVYVFRHPLWSKEKPRQDIPLEIYTISQWQKIQSGLYSVSAAPMAPTEIYRNKSYIFTVPARYNYAHQEGWQEVDEILKNNPISDL
jgi:hypothetical protein